MLNNFEVIYCKFLKFSYLQCGRESHSALVMHSSGPLKLDDIRILTVGLELACNRGSCGEI